MKIAAKLATLLTALWLAGMPADAAVHAVVIGIDDYADPSVSDLEGAVNDAEDLAGALSRRGAEVTKLLDGDATRSAVVSAVRRAIAASRPGDVVVITYAGHGTQQPEALPGDESDGRDELFLLHGFSPTGQGRAERLRDNDISALMAEAPPGVPVLLIADSCHSGTMTRRPVRPAAMGRSRNHDLPPLSDDPLPPPPVETFQVEADALPRVVFAAGARDNQEVVEVEIDGRPRGALSYSIARALEGAAAAGDGETTLADLRAYVRAQVRQLSNFRHDADISFAETLAHPESSVEAQAIHALFNALDEPLQRDSEVAGENAPPGLAPTPVVTEVSAVTGDAIPKETALVWNPGEPALTDRVSGDLVARPADAPALDAAVLAWRAARGLALWAPRRPADLRLSEGDGRHEPGDTLHVELRVPETAPSARYYTLVNLAATGEVQYVFPQSAHEEQGMDLLPMDGDPTRIGPIPVVPPFGTDTLIAILTDTRPRALRAELQDLNGTTAPQSLLSLLDEHAGDPTRQRVAILQIFTDSTP